MISIIGIGTGASAIAQKFNNINNYEIYCLNDKVVKNSKSEFKLKAPSSPEQCENSIPNLKKFFSSVRKRAQVFVIGSTLSSNYTLGILEQIKDREIELFYIQPDVEMLTGEALLHQRATFGILQEYARSGLFRSITLISNLKLENALDNISIKNYFDILNDSIYSTVHYLNFFEFGEPEVGQPARPASPNRIRSVGRLNVDNLSEKWFFDLDTPREICYYMCINEKRLETEAGLHRKIVSMLKDKPKNAYRNLSYAIYETPYEDFGFCVAHTNVIQTQENPLTNIGEG